MPCVPATGPLDRCAPGRTLTSSEGVRARRGPGPVESNPPGLRVRVKKSAVAEGAVSRWRLRLPSTARPTAALADEPRRHQADQGAGVELERMDDCGGELAALVGRGRPARPVLRSLRRSSSLRPAPPPPGWVSKAKRRQASWTAEPVLPAGMNRSASTSRQAARSRQRVVGGVQVPPADGAGAAVAGTACP